MSFYAGYVIVIAKLLPLTTYTGLCRYVLVIMSYLLIVTAFIKNLLYINIRETNAENEIGKGESSGHMS